MATCFFARTVHRKVAGTKYGGARINYLLREGAYSPAEARVHHLDKTAGAKHAREDVIAKDTQNLPAFASDAVTYFTLAEQYERGGQKRPGVISTEWKFSLPRELAREEQLAAARDFMSAMLGDTHTYVWAMHEPDAHDGGKNPHVHCLWSSRRLDGVDREPEQFFKQHRAQEPEKGGAEKDPLLVKFGAARRERQAYTDIMNYHLERAVSDVRLHPGKLADRGFDRTPEPRVAPSDSNKARYQNEITDAWQRVLDHRAARQPHIDQEQAQAWRAWERRKQELGIARLDRMDREAFVALVTTRTQEEARTPKPQLTLEELQAKAEALQAYVARLEQYANDVDQARQGQHVPPSKLIALLAGSELEESTGKGLTMKLYQKERDESYGR